ncbi:response regulator transcription factor [Streptomyces capitiformicae]|uniref:response regulator transcription factor n=1 Tax=Streptomyces capitiformicae TaxID=2014920 RepID=UPI001675A3A9|nr:response regulator transcription factor [Streptomyces capitiformicae]
MGAVQVTVLIATLHPVPAIVGAGPDGAAEATAAQEAGAVPHGNHGARHTPAVTPTASAAGAGTAQDFHNTPAAVPEADAAQTLVAGDIELDIPGFHVFVRGRSLLLPVREFPQLRYLMERPDKVVSRRELTKAGMGYRLECGREDSDSVPARRKVNAG